MAARSLLRKVAGTMLSRSERVPQGVDLPIDIGPHMFDKFGADGPANLLPVM